MLLPDSWALADLDKRAMEIYLRHLQEDRGWHGASVTHHVSALRNLFRFLMHQGHMAHDPLRTVRGPAPPSPGTVPEGEEAAVLRLFARPPGGLPDARLQFFLELFYGGGLRPSTVYRIVDAEPLPQAAGVRLTIADAEGPGTTKLELPLSPEGTARATRYLERRAEVAARAGLEMAAAPFWINARGGACKPGTLQRAAGKALAREGLSGGPSMLRRLAAAHFSQRGGDVRSVQRLLGARRLGALDRFQPANFAAVRERFLAAHPRRHMPEDE